MSQSTPEYKAWIASIKPGDQVAYWRSGAYRNIPIIATVEKITPTGRIRLENGSVFKNTGTVLGEGYHHIQPVTQDILDKKYRMELLQRFYHKMEWASFNTQTLEKVLAALEEDPAWASRSSQQR